MTVFACVIAYLAVAFFVSVGSCLAYPPKPWESEQDTAYSVIGLVWPLSVPVILLVLIVMGSEMVVRRIVSKLTKRESD